MRTTAQNVAEDAVFNLEIRHKKDASRMMSIVMTLLLGGLMMLAIVTISSVMIDQRADALQATDRRQWDRITGNSQDIDDNTRRIDLLNHRMLDIEKKMEEISGTKK